MLQFLASNTINTSTITRNKHALYGVNGLTKSYSSDKRANDAKVQA